MKKTAPSLWLGLTIPLFFGACRGDEGYDDGPVSESGDGDGDPGDGDGDGDGDHSDHGDGDPGDGDPGDGDGDGDGAPGDGDGDPGDGDGAPGDGDGAPGDGDGAPDNCGEKFETCGTLMAAFAAEAAAIRSCTDDDECGQELQGTSCGCTRNWVALTDADTTCFYALIQQAQEIDCDLGLASTCDCPPVDGFACVAGTCTWNYL